tara:strand:- start:168 stop:1280 length:1113 start_codon:yes stop_codon:yes gene_type:complete
MRNPINQYEPDITEADIEAVNEYLRSGGYVTEFKKTRELEYSISEYCQTDDSVIFPNGTLSLLAILKSLNIGRGDTVVVPNYTMAATAFAVIETGAEVIFCDIELPSCCICFDAFEETINCQRKIPKAVMLMSANGRYPSYEMNKFLSFCTNKGIKVIEDSAQSLGSYYQDGQHIGTKGVAGSFSFSMPKIITAGQGGAVISNDRTLISKLRSYRDFGRLSGGNDLHPEIGLNLKYTDLQATLALSQIKRIDRLIEIKKHNFKLLIDSIESEYLYINQNNLKDTTPWFYELITPHRENLVNWLSEQNIKTRNMYPELNRQGAFSLHHQHTHKFKNSSFISRNGLWLPSHTKLKNDDINRIIEALNTFRPN